MHVVIVGGGAVLAQPLIKHFLVNNAVTVVCRNTRPDPVDLSGLDVVWDLADPKLLDIDVLIIMPASFDNALIYGITDEQWNEVIEDTLTAPFRALRTLLSNMINGGNVVVVGSIAGKLGGRGCANYAAAKAGLVGLVSAAANEYCNRDLHINLLELGYMDVGMGAKLSMRVRESTKLAIPLRRFGSVEDFVLAVEFLSRTKYMTGNVLTLAGGIR